MFWVYILRCADGSYYTGHTDNFDRRMAQHQAGECEGYTAMRCPVELAWSQEYVTREEALSAEMQIKGWSRKKKEAMMRGDWVVVSRLARNKSADPSTGLYGFYSSFLRSSKKKSRGGGTSTGICRAADRLTEKSPTTPQTSMKNLAACALTADLNAS